MTHVFRPTLIDIAAWRVQSAEAAAHLKKTAHEKAWVRVGFVLNEGMVCVAVEARLIHDIETQALADHIYGLVLAATNTAGHA